MKRILLVEDNPLILKMNARYLASLGYAVEEAATVREAAACLARFEPDLVVLDVMLPDGDGVELCERIRRGHGMPILFLTAKVAGSDIVSGLKSGGDDYLTKPYDLDVFGAHVEALLRRADRELPADSLRRAGPLTFDLVKRVTSVNGTDLALSGKEYSVLYYLAGRRGQTVSREELCRAVWGLDTDAEEAILWTTVSRLKKKIAPYEELFYIDSDHSGYELIISPRRW